jgi:hypothetical protein
VSGTTNANSPISDAFSYSQPAFIEKISRPQGVQSSFRIIKTQNVMKRAIIISIILLAAAMQSCIVLSVHPFYRESDVVYRKELEGTWRDNDNNTWRIHKNPYKANSYELHYAKQGREVQLLGHLFYVNNDLYLDMVPVSDNTEEVLVFDLHMVPTHSVARVTRLLDNDVTISWLNEEWLRKMFTENRIKISHELLMEPDPKSEDDGMYLLTASTEELQGFIKKYGRNEEAYDGDLKLELTR